MSVTQPPRPVSGSTAAGSEHEPTEVLGPRGAPVPRRSGADAPSAGTAALGEPTAEEALPFPLGRRVGSIRVESRLAVGGVGELYQGFDENLRRKVALKALRGDRRSARWRSRLLREARILSRLQDPKICQIFGYVESEGTGYLVLELIEGRTLRQAATQDLEPAQRLRIAVDIAEVLARAHARGVIHRDLKPSNVMLAADGEVKVLDFGLASSAEDAEEAGVDPAEAAASQPVAPRPAAPLPSAIPGDEGAESPPTFSGGIFGTLPYMSPEQARGEPLSAASDVFTFGLLLQELFTGRRAYAKAPAEELAGRVREGRSLPPAGIDHDLAALIGRMKAVAPEERPPAAAVAERLRWIRDKPRRRMRRLAAAAAAAALALTLVFYIRGLAKQRNLALASEQRAVAARLEAEQVVGFLEEMFEVTDPTRSPGETVTARELLDRGAARIEAELAHQPLVQARLMATMGTVYLRLGLFERSEELLRRALEVRRARLPEGSLEIADSAGRLGWLLHELSRHAAAIELYEEAAAIHQAAPGAQSPEYVGDLRGLLAARSALSQYAEAEALGRRILAILEAKQEMETPAAAGTLRALGTIYRKQGLYDQALPYYERVRALDEAEGARSHGAGMTLYHLGITYTHMGRYPEAEAAYRRCREIWNEVVGPQHSDTAKIELALATLYRRLGRYPEAEAGLLRAMTIWEGSVSDDNVFMALAANNLGSVYLQQGRLDEAEAFYRRALAVFEATYEGGKHPDVSMALANLGELAWRRRRWQQAEALLRRALAIDEELSGPQNVNVAWDLHALANVERDRGRYDEAEALYQRSFVILDAVLGAGHPDVVAARAEHRRLLELTRR